MSSTPTTASVAGRPDNTPPPTVRTTLSPAHGRGSTGVAEDGFDLEPWLRDIGVTPSKVPSVAATLRENDLESPALLFRVTHDELKETGITSVGIRKAIVEAGSRERTRVSASTPMSDRYRSAMSPMLSPPPLVESPVDPSLLEYQVLTCCGSRDFNLLRSVASGQNGVVFEALCQRKGLPRPRKLFAVKLVYNYGLSSAATRSSFENEFSVLSQLPPHPNVIRFFTQFVDEIPDAALPHLPRYAQEQSQYRTHTGQIQRRKAQFVVLDYHPETFRTHRALLPVPLPFGACVRFAIDLLQAVVHLEAHNTCHLDLKPDNILVANDGRLVLCDFGTAQQFENDKFEVPYVPSMCLGGNVMHLAPEVLNQHERLRRQTPRGQGVVSYKRQEVWAVGVLIHTMVFGTHPWPDYPNDVGGVGNITYSTSSLPPYPEDYPEGFRDIVLSMLAYNPEERLSLHEALARFTALPLPFGPRFTPPRVRRTSSALSSALLSSVTSPARSIGAADTISEMGPEDRTVWASARFPASTGAGTPIRHLGADPLEPAALCGTVTVRYITGATITLAYNDSDTISTIIQQALRSFVTGSCTPAFFAEHRLLYAGQLLGGDAVVSSLGLDAESCLHLVRKPAVTSHPLATHKTTGRCESASTVSSVESHPPHVGLTSPLTAAPGAYDRSHSAGPEAGPLGIPPAVGAFAGAGAGAGAAAGAGACAGARAALPAGSVPRAAVVPGSPPTSSPGLKPSTDASTVGMGASMPGADPTSPPHPGFRDRNRVSPATGARAGAGSPRQSPYPPSFGPAPVAGSPGPRELRPTDVDTTLIRFKQTGLPAEVRFSNEGLTVETSGKWVTVMADMEGVSCGRLEWELYLDEARPGAGLAIGVADLALFYPSVQNLGVGEGSYVFSKTGQASIGGTTGFSDYGETFTHQCRVALDLDLDAGTLRFSINGKDQGIACCWGLRGRVLTPGIVMGTNKGGKLTKVTVVRSAYHSNPHRGLPHRIPFAMISHFNSRTTPVSITLSNSCRCAGTEGTWASLLAHPGEVEADVTVMIVKVVEAKPGAGLGIGIADIDLFDYKRHILGVSPGSLCLSKTGQVSSGNGFENYGEKYTTGDTICMVLDRLECTVRYYKNGVDQGIALSDPTLKEKRLAPALVLGSSVGHKVTRVRLVSSFDAVPAAILHRRSQAPALLI